MALVLKDRVRETSTTTGTGTFTLAGAVSGFQSFSAIGSGNTTYYTIADSSNWEVGIGTWTSPNQLARNTILASTNAGAAVNFAAGTKDVFVTLPAERALYTDASNALSSPPAIGGTTPAAITGTTVTAKTKIALPEIYNTSGISGIIEMVDGGDGLDYLSLYGWDGAVQYPVLFPGSVGIAGTATGGNFQTTGSFIAANGTTGVYVQASPSLLTNYNFILPTTAGSSGQYLKTDGTGVLSWGTVSGTGTVTQINTSGTVNGLTLTGGPITTTGTVTLGGTLDLSAPPAIGGTTPAAGTFTNIASATAPTLTVPALALTGTPNSSTSAKTGVLGIGPNFTATDKNILASFVQDINDYTQIVTQNINAGTTASADFIVNNNNTSGAGTYGDFGINSSAFTGTGSFSSPNAVYLYSQGGDLVIGTQSANILRFVIGSSTAADAGTVTSTGLNAFPIGATTASTGAFTTLSASGVITSTVATGTAPFTVASTTNVANLNASSLNGATFAAPGAIGGTTASTGAFTTLTTTGAVTTTAVSDPSAPTSGNLSVYAKQFGGYTTLAARNALNTSFGLQSALWQKNIQMWTTTAATAGSWMNASGVGNGTYTNVNPTAGSTLYQSIRRSTYANVITTLNQILGQSSAQNSFFRGSVSGQGGFFFYARCGFDVWTNGGRFFAGMATANTIVTADPSTLNNTVGFCVDAADNGAISFLTRGTAATKASTGFTIVSNKGYELYIYCSANSSQYTWQINDINAGTSASGTATANLPTNTTLQAPMVLASNAALTTATAISLGIAKIYAESDY